MATTGHESELISVSGLKSSLQKLKTSHIDTKAAKTAAVTAVGYSSSTITKTINGTASNVVTASTIVTDGGGIKSHQTIKQDGVTGATGNHYGVCSTAAATAAKAVSITGTPTLEAGLHVFVKFSDTNTAETPTLNVNSTGAKNIFLNGEQITTDSNKLALLKNIQEFVYDGTQWNMIGGAGGSGSGGIYSNLPLGVYAVYSDGTLKSYAEADTNAMGVAVITTNCAFGIAKETNVSLGQATIHSDLPDHSTLAEALLDFDGEHNSKILFYNTPSSDNYVGYTINRCNYRGYAGAAGEWQTYLDNRTEVDAMMSKIGGDDILRDLSRNSNAGSNTNYIESYDPTTHTVTSYVKYPSNSVQAIGAGILTSTKFSSAMLRYFMEGYVYRTEKNPPSEGTYIFVIPFDYFLSTYGTEIKTGYFVCYNTYVINYSTGEFRTGSGSGSVRTFFDLRFCINNE